MRLKSAAGAAQRRVLIRRRHEYKKVPQGSFLEGGPSRIIFLTPLQEGLMTPSKDGVACGGGGVGGFDIPGRSPKRPEELAKKEGERIVSPLE